MKVEASSVDEAEKATSSRGKTVTRKQSATHSATAKKPKVDKYNLIDVSDSD